MSRAAENLWRILFGSGMLALAGSLVALSLVVLSALDRPPPRPTLVEPASAATPPESTAEPPSASPQAVATPPSATRSPAASARPPAAPAGDVPSARLDEAIREALGPDAAGHVSVAVHRLGDGLGARYGADQVYYAASTFKLAVLYEALARRAAGRLDFAAPLELTAEDIAEDLGTLGSAGGLTVGDCLQAMIVVSDNSCAVALMRTFDEAEIDRTLLALGLRDTSVNTRDLPTTAADMARLMEALVTGEGIGPEGRDDAIRLLLAQQTRAGIPAGLPAAVPAGNKTGTYPGATHDVAFVAAPSGLYVIAALSDGDWAWEPIARVSAAVYRALESE